jgi:phosphoribosylformylglycinamidine synthase
LNSSLGENREGLAGSEWLSLRRGLEAGLPPAVDLAHERRLHELLATLVPAGLAPTAHDVSDGGLAVALCEACFGDPGGGGVRVELVDTLRPDALLFGEAPGRVLVATGSPDVVLRMAQEAGVPARAIGRTGGERMVIGPTGGPAWIDAAVARLRSIWAQAIPRRMESQ